jgi:hypothetical protein
MKKTIFLVLLIIFIPTAWAVENILPGNDFFPGWKKAGRSSTFIKADLFNYIDGGAELFIEFGFEKLTIQRYTKDTSEIKLEIYVMEGPESALGIYLMKSGQETPWPEIPARNSSVISQFTILKGKHFILVNNFGADQTLRPAMVALAKAVLDFVSDERVLSGVLERLPKNGLLPGSERLFRGPVALQPIFTFGEGDILELRGKTFGALADYRESSGAVFSRLIVPYPAPKLARSAFQNLRANLDPYLKIVKARDDSLIFMDYRNKFGVVELKESVLEIRINLNSHPRD